MNIVWIETKRIDCSESEDEIKQAYLHISSIECSPIFMLSWFYLLTARSVLIWMLHNFVVLASPLLTKQLYKPSPIQFVKNNWW